MVRVKVPHKPRYGRDVAEEVPEVENNDEIENEEIENEEEREVRATPWFPSPSRSKSGSKSGSRSKSDSGSRSKTRSFSKSKSGSMSKSRSDSRSAVKKFRFVYKVRRGQRTCPNRRYPKPNPNTCRCRY